MSKRRLKKILPTAITSIAAILGTTSAQATISNIDGVIIYQGLASVERSLPVDVNNSAPNGEQTLVFTCLSPYLNPNSISVTASPNVNLGEISIETLSGEQASRCQQQSDASVKAQQNKLAQINAEYEAAQGAKSYLQNLGQVSGIEMTQNAATMATNIETKLKDINTRLINISERQQQAQDELNQLMAGNVDFVADSVTQVSVRTASRQSGQVNLSYQVRGAGWQPTYKAHLDTVTNELKLTASAVIAQQTGENWSNIPLVLSTVNPNQSTSNSLPQVPRLSLYDENDNNTIDYVAAPRMQMERAYASPAIVVDTGGAMKQSPSQPLPSFNVSSSSVNGTTEYRLPQRISIPSDGRRVTTVIDTQQGTSKLWLRSTPEAATKAYWYASAPFLTPSWVDGTMQMYRDNNYIGQTTYSYQNLKEQGIGFGVAKNLIVKALLDEGLNGEDGILNRTKKETLQRAYEFTNLYNTTMPLQVLGSEPISQDEAIDLTITHVPPISERNWNDNNGVVAWEFDLLPNQTQVVQSTFEIVYPAKKQLRTN